jgi:GNAT superfamily N-acetyltransferase
MPPSISLRSCTSADRAFLLELYAETRAEELAGVGWDAAARQAFLRMQFEAQDRGYLQAHPAASFDVIVVDGEAAGRLYVDRAGEALHVIEIALVGPHRGRGVGTALLRDLLDEAGGDGRPVTLNVLSGSPARRLYERLGFAVVRADAIYTDMQWRAAATQAKTAS